MDKVLLCIDDYLKELEVKVIDLINDMSMPLTVKNQKMEPLADQKRVLVDTKKKLEELKNKNYIAECKMYQKGKND